MQSLLLQKNITLISLTFQRLNGDKNTFPVVKGDKGAVVVKQTYSLYAVLFFQSAFILKILILKYHTIAMPNAFQSSSFFSLVP